MNKKDKDLLIKDLSTRVFYGVKVNIERDFPNNPQIVERIGRDGEIIVQNILAYDIYYYKPYLRPMSSMTEEEEEEYELLIDCSDYTYFKTSDKVIDWLNAHHFDYRIDPSTGKTLIESGLAIEAPEGMYKTE